MGKIYNMRNAKGQFVRGEIRTKLCEICYSFFERNHKYSIKQWNESRACSRKCSGIIHSKEYTPTEKTREKIRQVKLGKNNGLIGENHPNWKGGITLIRKKLYFSKEYKNWRKAVFERDHYTCQECGGTKIELNADHIKPWAFFPELRFELSNGRTLCVPCHRKTDTWGNRKWAGGSAPTLTTTASKADMLGFVVTSAANYDGFVVGANI